MDLSPATVVFILGTITALATGLGAVPFLFVRQATGRVIGASNAIAGGLMLGASFGLLTEGSHYGLRQTIIGGAIGVVFILAGQWLLEDRDVTFGELRGAGARKVLLLLAIMTLHSFSEGVAVGVSFGGGQKLAFLITLAIAVHNIPEGVAITAVMRPQGSSLGACAAWSVVSSLPQPLMAVPSFLFVEAFRPVLPYGLGFAAGAMVFMVLLELLPEAYHEISEREAALWVSVTLVVMVLFQKVL